MDQPFFARRLQEVGVAAAPVPLLLGTVAQAEAHALLDSGMQQQLQDFIQHDEDEKQHSVHAIALEKLIRYQRDLLALLNNFVAFSQFYSRQGAAFRSVIANTVSSFGLGDYEWILPLE